MIAEIKVSVIVPVYNAEKYLEQCIVSILNQSLSEIEVIIINDGSTDTSKNIILEYCGKDSRIVFIDGENKGVSAARNKGIKAAKGKFIGFVDADDFVDINMYEVLYKTAQLHGADLAITNALTLEGFNSARQRLQLANAVIDMSKQKDLIVNDLLRFKYDYANWNKIYSTAIIQKQELLFNENMSMWEDILFNLIFIQYANTAVTVKDCLYNYRVHGSSIMADSTTHLSKQYNLFYTNYCWFCETNNLPRQLHVFKLDRAATCFPNIVRFIQFATGSQSGFSTLYHRFKSELKELNPGIYLFKDGSNSKSVIEQWILRNKWFTIYSFIYIGDIIVKNRLRQFIKGSA